MMGPIKEIPNPAYWKVTQPADNGSLPRPAPNVAPGGEKFPSALMQDGENLSFESRFQQRELWLHSIPRNGSPDPDTQKNTSKCGSPAGQQACR